MSNENTVSQKMERIQSIFREVQDSFSETTILDNYDIEFRSIAYEAASMCIALNDFKIHQELSKWFDFIDKSGTSHATQIHVGLGWALAQNEINPAPILLQLDPMMRYRILDGYGYCEGIFRRKKSILNQQKPEFTDPAASSAYDQGLGRSFWYLNNGAIAGAKTMLHKFPAERRADLWRGMGIAIAYVGGCSEAVLHEIAIAAETYKPQLLTGTAMALISRHYAAFISEDTAFTATILISKSIEKIISMNEILRSSMELKSEDAYVKWIGQLELLFAA